MIDAEPPITATELLAQREAFCRRNEQLASKLLFYACFPFLILEKPVMEESLQKELLELAGEKITELRDEATHLKRLLVEERSKINVYETEERQLASRRAKMQAELVALRKENAELSDAFKRVTQQPKGHLPSSRSLTERAILASDQLHGMAHRGESIPQPQFVALVEEVKALLDVLKSSIAAERSRAGSGVIDDRDGCGIAR